MALHLTCLSIALSLSPPESPAPASPPPAQPSTEQSANTPTAPQSFDPKVRRIGVQTLDETPAPQAKSSPAPTREIQATPDPSAPILPYTTPPAAPEKLQTRSSEPVCEDFSANCDPKPTFKFGAQFFMIPIADTGIGGRKDVQSRRIHQRARFSAAASWRSLGLKTEIQDVRQWGQGNKPGATADLVNLALYQGYLELVGKNKERGYHSFFRVGRQAIAWGEQRLLGYGEWTIHGRSHDALRAFVSIKDFEVDLFWSIRRPSQAPGPAVTENGSHLGGLRVASRHLKALSTEVFGLLHHDDGINPQTTDTLGNVGARVFGDPTSKLHYSVEGNYQFGKRNAVAHQAWAVAGWASWRQPLSGNMALRFKLGATAASGDKGDGKSREFFNFYPANHRNYGLMDRIGWRNMENYEAHVGMEFNKHLNFDVAYHYIGLQSGRGPWKDAPGNVLIPGTGVSDSDRSLASEIDFLANYRPLKAFHMQFGYGLWIPTYAGYSRMGVMPGTRRVQQRVFLLVKAQL